MRSMSKRRLGAGTRVCALLVTLLTLGPGRARADDDPAGENWVEVPDSEFERVFQGIIDANRANWQLIRTWKATGKFSIVDAVNAPFEAQKPETTTVKIENVKRQMQGTFEFALDVGANALFSKLEPLSITYKRATDGVSRDVPPEQNARWTVQTGEHSLTFVPGELTARMPGDPVASNWNAYHSRIARKQKREEAAGSAVFGDVIDPRILVWGRDVPIFEHWQSFLGAIRADGLRRSREKIRESGGRELRLERDELPAGPRYRVTIELSGGRFVTFVDMAAGANIVKNTFGLLDSDRLKEETNVSYSTVDGVFVPMSHEITTRNRATGQFTLTRKVVFGTQLLNGELDPATFTERAFSLRIGDRLIDQLHDQMYLVADEGRLVAPDEFERLYAAGVPGYSARKKREPDAKTGAERAVGGFSTAQVLVAGNLVLFVVIISFFWLRRRARPT